MCRHPFAGNSFLRKYKTSSVRLSVSVSLNTSSHHQFSTSSASDAEAVELHDHVYPYLTENDRVPFDFAVIRAPPTAPPWHVISQRAHQAKLLDSTGTGLVDGAADTRVHKSG